MPDMRTLIDICENAIQPITDWTSKNSVAMSLVELRRVVLSVKETALEYQSLYGDDASGSGDLLHVVSEFENQFMICHPIVNSLGESKLDTITVSFEHALRAISTFLDDNSKNFMKSKLAKRTDMVKLISITANLTISLTTAINRIEEIVRYLDER